MNDLSISRSPLDPSLRRALIQYVYGVIGCMQHVHRQLGSGMPEYIYQEALCRKLAKEQFDVRKEFIYHPIFEGKSLYIIRFSTERNSKATSRWIWS